MSERKTSTETLGSFIQNMKDGIYWAGWNKRIELLRIGNMLERIFTPEDMKKTVKTEYIPSTSGYATNFCYIYDWKVTGIKANEEKLKKEMDDIVMFGKHNPNIMNTNDGFTIRYKW